MDFVEGREINELIDNGELTSEDQIKTIMR
jgi:serine/threonine protein kinase